MFFSSDFLLVQDFPSEEVMKFPAFPTAMKVLFPWEAPNSPIRVPDFIFDHDFPLNELRITPLKPNAKNVSSA